MMNTCPICGVRRVICQPEFWPYRRRNNYFCSENCMIVFETQEYRERVGWIEERKGRKRMRLTQEQKEKAVRKAINGEDPKLYLKACGFKKPQNTWDYIKASLKEKNPDLYAQIPDMRIRKPHQLTSEIDSPVVIDGAIVVDESDEDIPTIKPEDIKPAEIITEKDIITARRNKVTGKAEREGFKVSAIRNELGEFYFDVKYNTIDWRSPEGEEVSMSPKAWFNLYMKIPDILGILGVEVDNDQSDS